ncbi:nephrin-like isoform X2 [Varroa jacobsoni]|uniref:nephrin-like isoform X2 n=1 Tax=Varroa jacobsoni TaxID=62625 RepID=UPI000BF296DD|nr:nephrin-like isoform X2 [Varroa jacobsoni]
MRTAERNANSGFTVLFTIIFFFTYGQTASPFEDDELTEPTIAIMGVLGERVNLPCDIHPNTTDDEVSLVLWYKDDHTTPIYSADARKTNLRKAHHSPAGWLAHRAYLKTEVSPSVLQMTPLQEGDEGLYRCRVDFKKARTRNYQVQLGVILPPSEPIITDQNGEILPTKSVIGPYNEGDKLILVCQVEGGNPPPMVTWWRESYLLDDNHNVSNGISKNVLRIPSLTRNDLMATFTCMASNNNISFPVSASVIIDLNFRPLSVWIEGEQRPLSAGKAVTLECRSSGSRPPALIEWWKGGIRMNSTSHNDTSVLTFVPTAEDSGKHLSCRAENSFISNSRIEDGWKIEVYYIPILTLRLGSKLRHQHIQEGNDVFFECDIRANPLVNDIGWRFEGKEVNTNTSAGVIVSNQSLVLQKVDLRNRGRYTCTAANAQGIGESNAVVLKVRYAPICAKDRKTTYGAARNEAVRILCELEGDPNEVTFKWRFNRSKDLAFSSNVDTIGNRSWLTIVPQTEEDYGHVICWGKNSVGLQREPCVFNLIPASPPDPVHNCSVFNQTEETLTVTCQEGYNGGIEQSFHMELREAEERVMRENLSFKANVKTSALETSFAMNQKATGPLATTVVISASGLAPSTTYLVAVWASNARGQSPPTMLVAHTMTSPVSLTRRGLWHVTLSPLLLILISVAMGILLVAFIIIFVMKIRTKQVIKNSTLNRGACEDKPQHFQIKKNIITNFEQSPYRNKEKCPDIIPPEPLNNCRLDTCLLDTSMPRNASLLPSAKNVGATLTATYADLEYWMDSLPQALKCVTPHFLPA